MNQFSFSGVTDVVMNGKYLTKGINENVEIVSVGSGKSAKKETPFINIRLMKQGGDPEKEARDFAIYMVGDSEYSIKKLKHIVKAACGKDVAESITGTTLEELANNLNSVLKGKILSKFKFVAEEYVKTDNTIGTRINIGLAPFCNGEFQKDYILKYDENNNYDYKRLVSVGGNDATTTGVSF